MVELKNQATVNDGYVQVLTVSKVSHAVCRIPARRCHGGACVLGLFEECTLGPVCSCDCRQPQLPGRLSTLPGAAELHGSVPLDRFGLTPVDADALHRHCVDHFLWFRAGIPRRLGPSERPATKWDQKLLTDAITRTTVARDAEAVKRGFASNASSFDGLASSGTPGTACRSTTVPTSPVRRPRSVTSLVTDHVAIQREGHDLPRAHGNRSGTSVPESICQTEP